MSRQHLYRELPPWLAKRGDILLLHTHSWSAALIRKATQSYWNHAALVDEPTDGDLKLLEAGPWGVRPALLSFYEQADKLLLRPIWDGQDTAWAESTRRKVIAIAFQLGPLAYDWPLILRLALQALLHIPISYKPDARVVCSEFVAEAWRRAGWPLVEEGQVPTPEALARSPRAIKVFGP